MRSSRLVVLLLAGCGAPDEDGDGWPADLDCDDASSAVHPTALETCNAVDDDCDGQVDAGAVEATPWFTDGDGDGVGAPTPFTMACTAPPGGVVDGTDCDDHDPAVKPGASELCNGRDDDCDGRTDEDAAAIVPRYLDADGDGHGDPAALDPLCVPGPSSVSLPDDCDDADAGVHPGAPETCDGVDQDCDTVVDEDATDALPWSPDADLDGFGWAAVVVTACAAPPGYVADGTDCDDFDGENHPGADERCDFVDNDCDALVDGPDAVDPATWYLDADADGFGSASAVVQCDAPASYVALGGDCNDADDRVSPFADEDCGNGVDDDCNGLADECGGPVGPVVTSIDAVATSTWTGAIDDFVATVVAGDLDGDGLDDLALGAHLADYGAASEAGIVGLAYGPAAAGDEALHDLPHFGGARASDRLTEAGALASGFDLDADGFDEVLLGSRYVDSATDTDTGGAWLLYGDPARASGAAAIATWDAAFTATADGVGAGLAGLGDVDGDGFDDAGLVTVSNGDPDGHVYLLFGGAARYAGVEALSGLPAVQGEVGDGLGFARGSAGADLDGDGLADVVMGASKQFDPHVHVLYGDPVRPAVVDAGTLPELSAASEGGSTEFADRIRPAGDVTGDGYEDVVVADHFFDSVGGAAAGQAWVLGGGAARWVSGDLADETVATVEGVQPGGFCGWEAIGVGDVSGDGDDDLAVSTPSWDTPYADGGAVGLFHGPLAGAIAFDAADVLFEAAVGGSFFGSTIAPADVDGDGLVDLAIAAQNTSGRGRVYLVPGPAL